MLSFIFSALKLKIFLLYYQSYSSNCLFSFNSYKFKATQLNRKIFECNGTLGVYMEPKKPLTEVEPFNFNTEQRAEVHKTKDPALNEVCRKCHLKFLLHN